MPIAISANFLRFELVINLKTAKDILDTKSRRVFLLRANRLINVAVWHIADVECDVRFGGPAQPVDATPTLNLPHAGLLGNKGKVTAY